MNNSIHEYVYLSKLFGACIDFVQGTGGNISVKSEKEIVIKKSGFAMSETTLERGYIVCSLEKLQQPKVPIEDSILYGDLPGKPSMEIYFHLLPAKYIIHIHPTSMLKDLCSKDFGRLKSLFPSALFVPYLKPGFELGDYIQSNFSSEYIIFLANHGVIFLGDSIGQILSTIDSAFKLINKSYSDVLFLHSVYSMFNDRNKYFVKPSFLLQGIPCPTRISRFTPDFHLFLGSSICHINYDSELSDEIIRYKQYWSSQTPSIVFYKGTYYFIGSSSKSSDYIEQMFYSYATSECDTNSIELIHEQKANLENDPHEIQRILLFKESGKY